MRSVAFKMKLKPGCAADYKRRHDLIWPELKQLLHGAGIYDYSIFLDEQTNDLFAVQKIAGSGDSQDLGSSEIIKKWCVYISDLLETNPDHSPVSTPLKEVFHLD